MLEHLATQLHSMFVFWFGAFSVNKYSGNTRRQVGIPKDGPLSKFLFQIIPNFLSYLCVLPIFIQLGIASSQKELTKEWNTK